MAEPPPPAHNSTEVNLDLLVACGPLNSFSGSWGVGICQHTTSVDFIATFHFNEDALHPFSFSVCTWE
jgi:hypothetical protein